MGGEKFMFDGWWIIPMIMCILMMIFAFIFFSRGGFRPPWMQGSERDNNKSTDLESPVDLLKRRYAKGEITKEEYEQMKKDLEG